MLSEAGVRFAALTDHDTCDGTEAFRKAASRRGIACITGIEITVRGPGGVELHLLGYGFDPANGPLNEALRNQRTAACPPPPGTVQETWLRPRGEDARRGSPAALLPVAEAISLLHAAGGIAVLAHPLGPGETSPGESLEALLCELKDQGLDGIEAIYSGYTEDAREALVALAGRHQLCVSAGSDFHALSRPGLCEAGIDMPTPLWRQFRDAVLSHGPEDVQEPARPEVPERRSNARWGPFILRIVFPTFLAVALFIFAIYEVIIPSFEARLLDRKREMIHELTNVACGILAEYDNEVRAGRMSLEQAQQIAVERIQGLRYGKEGKDYFWIMDTYPRMVSHPYRPELNGRDLTDFRDQRGDLIFVEFVNVLRTQDAEYVEYVWQWKDDPSRLAPKESYIKKFAPWEWIVGTGLYTEDVQVEIDAMEARMVHVSSGITIFSILLLAFVAYQTLRIEQRRRYVEDELRESHEKYRTLAEAATDGILMVIDGRCTYANRTMAEMLGYAEAEFSLLDLADVFPDDSSSESVEHQLSDGRGVPLLLETLLRKKGGETVAATVTITPVSSAGRSGFILAARDLGARDLGARDLRDPGRRRREIEQENLIAELQSSLMFLHEPISSCATEAFSCDLRDPISRAVELMAARGASAILVKADEEAAGIVTERDICERVVARGLSPDEPLFRVMSSPVVYTPHQCAVYEAILAMREHGIRHLVARDDAGQIAGMVDMRDLLHFHRYTLAVLLHEVGQATSPEAVASIHGDLPGLVNALIVGGTRTRTITRSITAVSDAIVRQLVHLAIQRLGPPPARFAFLALGSAGREEQTLVCDQDNAVVFDDVEDALLPAAQDYFNQLGALVCDWLERAGYPRCPGNIMAANPACCQPLRAWKECFSEWIAAPEPQNILDIMTFFDFRAVYGEESHADLLRHHIQEEIRTEPAFLLHYARYALQYKIPIGFFGKIVVESGKDHPPSFNIKEGMMPVVNFARLYALRHDVTETNTVDRIRSLMELGMLRESLHDEALQVYDCLMQLRLEHQADALAHGLPAGNAINLKTLTHMKETLLREAFAQIAHIQRKISFDFLGGT